FPRRAHRLVGGRRAQPALRRTDARLWLHAPRDGPPRPRESGNAGAGRRAGRHAAAASLIALLLAAALIPRGAQAALVIEDVSGLRDFLAAAGKHAPSLSPESLGPVLRKAIGVDLLAEQPEWGLALRGARVVAISRDAVGLAAPLLNPRVTRRTLAAWRAERDDRAGKVIGKRLFLASGRGAPVMVSSLAHPVPLPKALASPAHGPAWLYARMTEPLTASVLALEASGQGLSARGMVTARAPILAGVAPAGCDGSPTA